MFPMTTINSHQPLQKIYAVVVTYNGVCWVERCLESLMLSEYPVDTIVVDNASTDETAQLISNFRDVIYLEQQKNLGFGKANNIGIREALQRRADFVFLLNQDACVTPNTIGRLIQVAQKNSKLGVLSPIHLNGDGSAIDAKFAQYIINRGAPNFLSDLYFGDVKDVYRPQFTNAAAWLLSRKCIEVVGGFDPLFFMYSEDNDFCNRVSYHGFQIGLVPSAVIHHDRCQNKDVLLLDWLNRGSERRVSGMIALLKRPSRRFSANFVHWCRKILLQSLECFTKFEFSRLGSIIIATAKVLARLPKIRKHHRMSRRPGAHWINHAS